MGNIVYYGLTEDESKQNYLEYKSSEKFNAKGINLDLEGLRNFIKDSKLEDVVKYYTKIELNNFEIAENIYKHKKYNMIAVKIPFKIKITEVYDLFK